MYRLIAAVLLGVCATLQMSAQAAPQQTPTEQTPTGQKPAEAPSYTPTGPAIETDQFPLDKFRNFSAIENGTPLPHMNSDVYMYRSGDLMRVEGSVAIPSYNITDLVKRKSQAITAHNCFKSGVAYIRTYPFFVSAPGAKYEIVPVGEEIVDGHHCHVENVTIHTPISKEVMYLRFFEADDLQGFPIKIENTRNKIWHWTLLYKDVRLGPQDPSLFIIPDRCDTDAGFKKAGPKTSTPPAKKVP